MDILMYDILVCLIGSGLFEVGKYCLLNYFKKNHKKRSNNLEEEQVLLLVFWQDKFSFPLKAIYI